MKFSRFVLLASMVGASSVAHADQLRNVIRACSSARPSIERAQQDLFQSIENGSAYRAAREQVPAGQTITTERTSITDLVISSERTDGVTLFRACGRLSVVIIY
jgi:hypothetical protein